VQDCIDLGLGERSIGHDARSQQSSGARSCQASKSSALRAKVTLELYGRGEDQPLSQRNSFRLVLRVAWRNKEKDERDEP